jgi:hypothetical protein
MRRVEFDTVVYEMLYKCQASISVHTRQEACCPTSMGHARMSELCPIEDPASKESSVNEWCEASVVTEMLCRLVTMHAIMKYVQMLQIPEKHGKNTGELSFIIAKSETYVKKLRKW